MIALLIPLVGILTGVFCVRASIRLGKEIQLHNDLARSTYAFEKTMKDVAAYGKEHNMQMDDILRIIESYAKSMKTDLQE